MKNEFKPFDLTKYQYTDDLYATDAPYKVHDRKIKKRMEKVYTALISQNSGYLAQAEKFYRNHPHIVQAKNYLVNAYLADGQFDRSNELNDQLLREHPDFLYAINHKASYHYYKGEPEKMLHYLGEDLELKTILPDRKVFHDNEILAYLSTSILYLITQKEFVQARQRYEIMEEIDSDHHLTLQAYEYLSIKEAWPKDSRRKRNLERELLMGENEIPEQKNQAPILFHQELKILYEEDFYIDPDEMAKLLSLPRETLIKDLEKILLDGIYRYYYFRDELDFDEDTHSFPSHAFFMLGELKASESLDTLLYFLGMPEELLALWLGEKLLESGWQVVYSTGNQQLQKLSDYLMNQKNYLYAATEVSVAVEQIVYHQPERRKEVIDWYIDVLEKLLDKHLQGEIVNTELISFLVWANLNFQGIEITDVVERLYAEDLIEEDMIGDLDNIKLQLTTSNNKISYKKALFGIIEIYEGYDYWEDDDPEDFEDDDNEDFENGFDADQFEEDFELVDSGNRFTSLSEPEQPRKVEKVGRNEPCPCGSGKKYKKCCGMN